MTILLLKGYNNYFNRIVKQEESVSAYIEASTSYLEYSDVNFDPQDGIMTSLIVGGPTQQQRIIIPSPGHPSIRFKVLNFDEGGSPDYLVCHKNTSDSDEIISRWFVTECVKIRQGQYKLALKRDVLVDFNKNILDAPCFVEKGTISDASDALLLNSEGMSFNQIKTDQKYLTDETKCAWLVGYLKKDLDASALSSVNPVTLSFTKDAKDANELSFEECIQYYDYNGQPVGNVPKTAFNYFRNESQVLMRVNYQNFWLGWGNLHLQMDFDGIAKYVDSNNINADWQGLNSVAFAFNHAGSQATTTFFDTNQMNIIGYEMAKRTREQSVTKAAFNNLIDKAIYDKITANNMKAVDFDELTKWDGQIIEKNGHKYKLRCSYDKAIAHQETEFFSVENSQAIAYLNSLAGNYTLGNNEYPLDVNTSNPTLNKVRINLKGKIFFIEAYETFEGTVTYSLPESSLRNNCSNAPYDMFAIPFIPAALGYAVPEYKVMVHNGKNQYGYPLDTLFSINAYSDIAFNVAMKLSTALGAGTQNALNYDLQLLPYCPFEFPEDAITVNANTGQIRIDVATLGAKDYSLINANISESDLAPVGIVLYPQSASLSKNINVKLPNVHEEKEAWATVMNPIFEQQGLDDDDYPLYWLTFPYEIVDINNINLDTDLELPEDLQELIDNEEFIFYGITLTEGNHPILYGIYKQQVDYPTSLSFEGNLRMKADWIFEDEAIDVKIKNECDMYRLTSPNYNGMFEFKKTKLRDGIQFINVDLTFKPVTPYIKLNPNLEGSYYATSDFNDSTGLICSGDFSLPMLTDAWVNYELNNRNYQAIFNRQIENLDVNQQIAKEQQQFQGIAGMITGGVGGAGAGAYAGFKASGSPWGAAIGAAVGLTAGTTLSGVGFAKDREWLREQQTEARDFAIDQFQYQLGNVKALPQTITKSSPLSYNNKIWPVLEHYTCTDREKNVLKDKIKYNGMTIMAIGKLADYMVPGGYLKGKLIRLNDLNDDSHVANAIYEEVDKGFYEGE